jgi:hypothetical protein
MNAEVSERDELFWALAESVLARPAVSRSTMMGFPCLRMNGDFFACVERGTGNLIVKLPADRVNELVGSGVGIPFAPNGRMFREWVACPVPPTKPNGVPCSTKRARSPMRDPANCRLHRV